LAFGPSRYELGSSSEIEFWWSDFRVRFCRTTHVGVFRVGVFETVFTTVENRPEEFTGTRQRPDCLTAKHRLFVIISKDFMAVLVVAGITDWQHYVHQFKAFTSI
jgi:hypothetical protein